MKLKFLVKKLCRPFEGPKEAGMTIIEILIVIALMGTIMAVLVTKLLDKNDDAKADLTSVAESRLSDDIKIYKLNNFVYPSTEEGLQALLEAPPSAKNWRGPYIDAEKVNDSWGKPFQYELINAKNFKLSSAGADGEFGTEDDVIFPKEAAQSKDEAPVTTELKVPEGNLNKSTN